MNVGDIRFYKERWKAVEEIERWKIAAHPYRPIERMLIVLGIRPNKDVEKMQIIMRWAKIKAQHETGLISHGQRS